MSLPLADEVFLAALERPKAEWSSFVRRTCGNDSGLRRSVFSLLRSHEQTGPSDRLGSKLSGLVGRAAWRRGSRLSFDRAVQMAAGPEAQAEA